MKLKYFLEPMMGKSRWIQVEDENDVVYGGYADDISLRQANLEVTDINGGINDNGELCVIFTVEAGK